MEAADVVPSPAATRGRARATAAPQDAAAQQQSFLSAAVDVDDDGLTAMMLRAVADDEDGEEVSADESMALRARARKAADASNSQNAPPPTGPAVVIDILPTPQAASASGRLRSPSLIPNFFRDPRKRQDDAGDEHDESHELDGAQKAADSEDEDDIDDLEADKQRRGRMGPALIGFFAVTVFVVLVMIPGLVCYYRFPAQCMIANVSLLSWSLLVSFVALSYWLLVHLFKIIVFFARLRYLHRRNFVYFLDAVERSLAATLTSAFTLVLWLSLPLWKLLPTDALDTEAVWWITPLLLSFLFTSAVWMVKAIALKLFSLRFLKRAYFDRMKLSLYAEHALLRLTSTVFRKNERRVGWAGASALLRALSHSQGSAPLNDRASGTSKGASSYQTSTFYKDVERLANLVGERRLHIFSSKTASSKKVEYAKEARVLGSELFQTMIVNTRPDTDPHDPEAYLEVIDFIPFVSKTSEAPKVFELFDVRATGQVTRADCKAAVQKIYRERKHLAGSLHDSNNIIGTLNRVVSCAAVFALFFLYLYLFRVNVSAVLLSMSSIVLSLVFAIGNSLKRLVEVVIFLFVTHPYDVGDRIIVDNVEYVVLRIGLMSTTMMRDGDQRLYYPNYILCDKVIFNVRRSGDQPHIINVTLDAGTTSKQLDQLRDHIAGWAATQPMRFDKSSVMVTAENIVSRNLSVTISVSQHGNVQDYLTRNVNRTLVVMHVHAIIKELGLFPA